MVCPNLLSIAMVKTMAKRNLEAKKKESLFHNTTLREKSFMEKVRIGIDSRSLGVGTETEAMGSVPYWLCLFELERLCVA